MNEEEFLDEYAEILESTSQEYSKPENAIDAVYDYLSDAARAFYDAHFHEDDAFAHKVEELENSIVGNP